MPRVTRIFSSVPPHHKLDLVWASGLKKENVGSDWNEYFTGIPTVTGAKPYSAVRLKKMNPWSFSILQVIKAFLDQRQQNETAKSLGIQTRTFWPRLLQANCTVERSPCSICRLLIMQDCSGLLRYTRDGERLEAVALNGCQTFVRVYTSAV